VVGAGGGEEVIPDDLTIITGLLMLENPLVGIEQRPVNGLGTQSRIQTWESVMS
jgi:hypothetical protein